MRSATLLLLLAVACGDDTTTTSDSATPTTTTQGTDDTGATDTEPDPVDLDQDGVWSDRDCDDADPDNFPGNLEFCDGADNNCNGVVDDDPYDIVTWYQDADQDGYGTDVTQAACEQPTGFVDNDEDCDDLDPAVYPGATEACDGTDQDCDDYVDEDVEGEELRWYADSDGDGFGSPYYTEDACSQPSGHVANSDDCDDLDAEINPDGTESCDGVDNDCDGAADEGSPTGSTTWYIDYDGDGYGATSFTSTACEAPSGYVDDTSDCDDTDQDVHPGATEICNDSDDDCDTSVDEDASLDLETWFADDDGDGYGDGDATTEACSLPSGHVDNDDDCDDDDAAAYPGASESCDGSDEDCDGDVDEDPTDGDTWWIDLDGDGYGNLILTATDCDQPTGYVDNDDDCDDLEADAWPGNTEVCDGIDNDCDTDADEAGASDAATWYADADGDSFGDPDTTAVQCDVPSGYVSGSADCDDASAAINPSALEQCDSTDNDCDGDVDEDGAFDVVPWYEDVDGDGYGDPAVSEDHCEAPTGFVADDTDCDDDESAVNPGEAEICGDTLDNDCSGDTNSCRLSGRYSTSDADAHWIGESSDYYAGYSVDLLDDVDGDGLGDLLIGSFGHDDGGSYAGAAHVVFGPTTGTHNLSGADVQLTGENSSDYAGYSVAWAGDVDGDGYGDLLVGAEYNDDYTSNAGAGYLVLGPPSSMDLSSAATQFYGESSSYYLGAASAGVGDTNGDGYDDVIFGSYCANLNGSHSGGAYFWEGPSSSSHQYYYDADARFIAEASSDYAGWSVAGGGDVDGDGNDDILIGAIYNDEGNSDAGAAYLVYGGSASGDEYLSSADAKLLGDNSSDYAGRAVALGDINDDDVPDLIVTADHNDEGGTNSGSVYIVFGPASGAIDLRSADVQIIGESSYDYVGSSVSVGDVDGDGADDLFIGATGVSNGSSQGSAYLLHGPLSGRIDLFDTDAEITCSSSSDYCGQSVAAGVDVDGDGIGDMLIGAPYDDETYSTSGSAFLFLGSGE